jgi:O-antigen ligase
VTHVLAPVIDRAGFYLLAFCVACAPIPFGSNSDGLAGFLGCAIGATLAGTLASPEPGLLGSRVYLAALAIAAAVALWSTIQVLPLGGLGNAIWQKTGGMAGSDHVEIAVARLQPLYSLGYVLLPIATFVSALVYIRNEGRYTTFLHIVVGIGCITTVICIGQYLYAPKSLLWIEKKHYLQSFTGSFINPNTAAAYFGLAFLMSLSAGLRQLERVGGRGPVSSGRAPNRGGSGRWGYLLAYLAVAFVFLVALMLTQSRVGILASLAGAGCLVVAFGYLILRRRMSLWPAIAVATVVLSGAGFLLGVYSGRFLRDLDTPGLVGEERACAFRSTWRAIQDHFWAGTGLGTFQDVFPHYRMPQCGPGGHWNQAHNFFLEGALSLGVVLFSACVLVAYLGLIWVYAKGMRERRRLRFVPVMCLCALLTLTLNALVDFSLQIPAIAVLASAVLGAGAAISTARTGGAPRRQRAQLPQMPPLRSPNPEVGAHNLLRKGYSRF